MLFGRLAHEHSTSSIVTGIPDWQRLFDGRMWTHRQHPATWQRKHWLLCSSAMTGSQKLCPKVVVQPPFVLCGVAAQLLRHRGRHAAALRPQGTASGSHRSGGSPSLLLDTNGCCCNVIVLPIVSQLWQQPCQGSRGAVFAQVTADLRLHGRQSLWDPQVRGSPSRCWAQIVPTVM